MNIDIQALVNAKLKEMEEGKVLENLISNTVESAVTKAVKDAIDGYSIKRIIEDKIEKDVKKGVEAVGFCAYNTIVAEQVKNLIDSVIKDDVAEKVNKIFTEVMINKREKVKLSEIVEEYRKIYEDIDYEEAQELDEGHFRVYWEEDDDRDNFVWYTICFSMKEQAERSSSYGYRSYLTGDNEKKIKLRLLKYKENDTTISSAEFEGKDISKMDTLRNMSNFEAFIMNLVLNKTQVEIDITEDDIDTYVGGEYCD